MTEKKIGSDRNDSQDVVNPGSGSDQFPVMVNGHRVVKISPKRQLLGCGVEYDRTTAFECTRCGHHMVPPKRRIKDSEWTANAFDCVECDFDA